MVRSFVLWLTALFAAVLSASATQAHEVRPASLQITEHAAGNYVVVWKQPTVGDMAIHLVPHLSGKAIDRPPDQMFAEPGQLVKQWQVSYAGTLEGQTLAIEGLSLSVTDVLVRITTAKGEAVNDVIHPASPALKLHLGAPGGIAVPAYLKLGVEHILTGFDHLLFVLGLLLITGVSWRIVKAVSAFTVAHSITLAPAALGYIHFPSAIIEALVALSIVFIAYELAPGHDQRQTLTRRHPWAIAFTFGLLHGLAFAGALAEIGLPAGAAPQALFLFNAGVEIGQLLFIGAAIAVILAVRRVRRRLPEVWAPVLRYAPSYIIGTLAACWFIERTITAYS